MVRDGAMHARDVTTRGRVIPNALGPIASSVIRLLIRFFLTSSQREHVIDIDRHASVTIQTIEFIQKPCSWPSIPFRHCFVSDEIADFTKKMSMRYFAANFRNVNQW